MSVEHLAFACAALLIGISKAGFGGGIGILTGPVLTIFFGAKPAVGKMLPLLVVCDAIALYPYWRQWDWPNVRNLLAGGVLGIVLGWLALHVIDDNLLTRLIGLLAIVFSLLQFARVYYNRDDAIEPGFWPGFGVGLATGFVSTLSHVGGLLTSMYLLMQKMDSRRFVATTTLFYFWINLLKMPAYWQVGMIDEQTLLYDLPFVPVVFAGVALGVVMNRYVSDVWFGRIVYGSVLVIGVYLLVK
ncbi:MAG: sulfite exporter TauE/SafE family protein [Planctomycetes bacterium]|nr:sulfite exporter TauE/SafE family protein [Planctomycetota bacterium]